MEWRQAGYDVDVKLWHHIVAGLVGISLAGLIVFFVFGNASREGAVQDAAAPDALRGGGETLCGTITPAEANSSAARRKALANPPTIIDPATKRATSIAASATAQRSWLARVHAASGLRIDELSLSDDVAAPLTITLSTTEDVSDLEAAAFAGGAVMASFSPPLRRDKVVLTATVGESTRTVSMTARTFNAFQARRASLGLGTSVVDMQSFKRRFPAFPLTITGW